MKLFKRKREQERQAREQECTARLRLMIEQLIKEFDCAIYPDIQRMPDGSVKPMLMVKARNGSLRK